jgi:hypothetical protein
MHDCHYLEKGGASKRKRLKNSKGSITLAFWMCVLGVRFTVKSVVDVIFSV